MNKKKILGILSITLCLAILGCSVAMSLDNQASFIQHLQNCENYSYATTSDYMGMRISYDININGWKNDKCILNLNANINASTPSANTLSMSPKINCEFTKEQLDEINEQYLSTKSTQQGNEKVMDIVMNQNACSIQNIENIDSFTTVQEGQD